MDIVNRMCGSFIHLSPTYKKMWCDVVEFNKKYPSITEYTYTDFFKHNVSIGVFFSNYHYPRSISHKLFYYVGIKTGWLKRYKTEYDRSMDNARNVLEDCLTPKLKKMLKDKLKDAG